MFFDSRAVAGQICPATDVAAIRADRSGGRVARIGDQPGGLDAGHGADLVLVGQVAGDADRALRDL
jgi:hypothetical protein